MNGSRVVERAAAAKIVAFDERNRQSELSGIVGDGEAVDSAAYDEYVKRLADQTIEITDHFRNSRLPGGSSKLEAAL